MSFIPPSPESLEASMEPEIREQVSPMAPDELMATIDGVEATGTLRNDTNAGMIAAASGNTLDEQVIARASFEPDTESALDVAADQYFTRLEAELSGTVNDEYINNRIDVQQATQALNVGLDTINERRSAPNAREEAIIASAATTSINEDVRKELGASLAMRNTLAKMMDEQGVFDMLLDVGGMFVPGRHALEWEDVEEGVAKNNVLSQHITGDNIASMITSWQLLPLEKRESLFPVLTETVLKATGITGVGDIATTDQNTLLAVGMLVRFLEPEGASRATLERNVILGIDIASIIPAGALARLGKVGRKQAQATGARVPGGARRPTPDEPFPKTDPSKGVEIEGEIIGKTMSDIGDMPEDLRKAMEGVMFKAGDYARRSNNMVKIMKEAGDPVQAARMNNAVFDSEAISRAYAIPTDVAVENAMPFQTQMWFPQATKGLVPEVAENLNEFHRVTEGLVRSMTTESELLQVGALSKPDRQLSKKKFFQEMNVTREDYMQEGISLSEVRLTKEDAQAFEFEYTLTNKQGFEQEFKGRRSWQVNQVTQNFEETAIDLAEGSTIPGISPAAWGLIGREGTVDFGNAVKEAIMLEDVAVATKMSINELFVTATDPIAGATQAGARRRVEAVETAGDAWVNDEAMELGKVFSPEELKAGVNTSVGKVRLTDPVEVEAYYNRRLVADAFHAMQNYVTRREMELDGMKAIILHAPAGEGTQFGRVLETAGSAQASVRNKQGFAAFDNRELKGNVKVITDELLAEVYAGDAVMVKLGKDWNTTGNEFARGGEFVEYVIVPRTRIQQLPEQVVNYRNGYVPKIAKHTNYVVQRAWPISKAGTKGRSQTEALRRFASKMDAETFMADLAAKEAAKRGIPVEEAARLFQLADDTVMTQVERMDNGFHSSSGMFTETRAKDDILMGLTGVTPEFLSPSEAYGRYIDHLGNKISKNEWVYGKQRQWINTVREQFPETVMLGFDNIKLPDDAMGKALARERDQIQKWSRVPSRQESLWEGFAQNVHDYALTGGRRFGLSKEAVPLLQSLKHAEPVNAVLAANMHLTLGMMNPSQLYVQSSAALVALSLNKIREIPHVVTMLIDFSILDRINNPLASDNIIKRIRNKPEYGDITADLTEAYRLWERSGLREAVKSNADMNYMSTTGLGIVGDTLRKGSNVSLMMYREAELVNRRTSFISAYTQVRKANPNAKHDDDFLAEVLSEANKTMLELNGANKAWWQGGKGATGVQKTLSMSTQFMQVLAKTTELIVKGTKRGGFTSEQKRRIAIAQTLFHGAAGMPLLGVVGTLAVTGLAELFDLDGTDADDAKAIEDIANAYNQGITGLAVRNFLGAEIDVSSRAALGAGVFSAVKDVVTSSDPMFIRMLGLTGETGRRVGDALMAGGHSAKSLALAELAKLEPLTFGDRTDVELTKENYLAAAKDMLFLMTSIPSSTRNIFKARMMYHSDKLLDRRGKVRIEDDFKWQTELGVSLGFRTNAESRLQAVMDVNFRNKELVRSASDIIINAYHRYVYLHNADETYAQNLRILVASVQQTLDSPALVEQLTRSLEGRIFDNPQTVEERALLEFYKNTATDKIKQGYILDEQGIGNIQSIFTPTPVVVPFAGVDTQEDNQ